MEQLIRTAKALLDSLGSYAAQNHHAIALRRLIDETKGKVFFPWSTADITAQAEAHDCSISDEDAEEVLSMMKKHHNASVGINWEVIDIYIELFVLEKRKAEKTHY